MSRRELIGNWILGALLAIAALNGWNTWQKLHSPPKYFMDPVLQVYYDEFKADAKKAGLVEGNVLTRLEFGDMKNEDWLGFCEQSLKREGTEVRYYYTIKMRNDDWPDILLKATIYHEFAHCVYGLPHDRRSTNLMYPIIKWNITEAQLNQQIRDMFREIAKIQRGK